MQTPGKTRLTAFAILVTLVTAGNVSTAGKGKFKHWCPDCGQALNATLQNNCSVADGRYLTEHYNASCKTCVIGPVVDCILAKASTSSNANLQSAGVVLGLLPTCLALAGSSTAEKRILALRRPLLATCSMHPPLLYFLCVR